MKFSGRLAGLASGKGEHSVKIREWSAIGLVCVALGLGGCESIPEQAVPVAETPYLIGAHDTLRVFVWRSPELSMTIPVRPDGTITVPLVEDMQASGKSATQLARDIEKALAKYVQDPVVTVIVTSMVGHYSQQVRVIGEAAKPQTLVYRKDMTLVDVMIAVGGITLFADGNAARIVRTAGGKTQQFRVRLKDLVWGGDVSANVEMRPGDVLIIPQSFF
jgi:polysaccharide export outer membrane protein